MSDVNRGTEVTLQCQNYVSSKVTKRNGLNVVYNRTVVPASDDKRRITNDYVFFEDGIIG